MLYLIGLGLNEKGISLDGIEAIKKCSKIYLESYTVDFPYRLEKLEYEIRVKIEKLGRNEVESDKLVKEAKKSNIVLLIYGSPLFATTHQTLINDCKKNKVKIKIIFNTSVFDAISETGLQLYKFGKISSMPKWQKNFEPDSFLDYVLENKKIKAHSLILIDIGLKFAEAIDQLELSCMNKKVNLDKIVVCTNLGCESSKIFYGNLDSLKKIAKKISSPYCFIIPSDMHFIEKESLERFDI